MRYKQLINGAGRLIVATALLLSLLPATVTAGAAAPAEIRLRVETPAYTLDA